MELILLEKVAQLGDPGDLVKVKSGYGRNFLIPTGKAIRADEENKTIFKKKREEIIDAVKLVNQGKGVVILTDMFGGTPSNLAISIMEEEKVEVVAGVNLPMLIKISSLRTECNIKELIKVSQESGRKYMNVASAFFGESDNCKKKN